MKKDDGTWYYCVWHRRVEPSDGCWDADRIGPYATMAEAEEAAKTVVHHTAREHTRDRSWDDEMWNDDGT